MRRLSFAAVPLLTALTSATALAQAQPAANVSTRTLTRPEVEFAEPFSGLTGIRELRDGRVIVADRLEKFIAILDLAKGSKTTVGHEGQGPGEFAMPMAVYPYPGDSTLVQDMLGRKFLKIGPGGTLGNDVSQPVASAGGGRVMTFSSGGGGADLQGRIYSQGSSIIFGADGTPQPIDSAAITRWDIRSGRTDTLTFIKVPLAQITQAGRGGGGAGGGAMTMGVRMGGPAVQPFVVRPAWTVAPDGRVALISAEPYQVTWISPSKQRSAGAPIPYTRIKVTEAEKAAYRESMKSSPQQGMTVRMGGSGPGSVSQTPIPFQEPDSWPEFKGAYAQSAGSIMIAPTGELWILKQRAHTEKVLTFDLIGARGELLGRVAIPDRTRLLGFGENGAVYLVRRDADDLEYLQRHRLANTR